MNKKRWLETDPLYSVPILDACDAKDVNSTKGSSTLTCLG